MNNDFSFGKCIVCGTRKQYEAKLQFFKFPNDVDRCRSWVKFIGIRDLLFMPFDDLRQLTVCEKHFNPACINERIKRLHKVAIPKHSHYPPLSDELMRDFPKIVNKQDTAPVMHTFCDVDYTTTKRREKATPKILNGDPVIDYERPLMNSLETLIHNERHAVKKPAGILNSIAVPLMTYSSSLEKGTVFAAEHPGRTFQMPIVPFIEAVNHNDRDQEYRATRSRRSDKPAKDPYYPDASHKPNDGTIDHLNKATKKYVNAKVMALSTRANDSDVLPTPNTEQIYTDSADSMFESPVVGTVKPKLKTVERGCKTSKVSTQRDGNVYLGLNTVITGSHNGFKHTNANDFDGTLKPTRTDARFKGIKQYSNNKLPIQPIQKNISLVPICLASDTETDTIPITPDARTTDRSIVVTVNDDYEDASPAYTNQNTFSPPRKVRATNSTMAQVYKLTDSEHTHFDISIVATTDLESHEATANDTNIFDCPATISSNASLVPSAGSTDTDLMFEPYTQYAATVTPESTNAHTGEGTLNYGLPLMNCIGTIFQGNIHSTIKTEEADTCDETAIDIPLMRCFKTLEHSSIL